MITPRRCALVLDAIRLGASSARAISAVTDIPAGQVRRYAAPLAHAGLVRAEGSGSQRRWLHPSRPAAASRQAEAA